MIKKVISWLLAVALTATVSIGATLAYLTDTDEDVNVMTLGKVKIDQLEYERVDVESKDDKAEVQEFHDNKPLLPAVAEKDFNYTPGTSYVDWAQIGKDGYTSPIWDPDLINNEVDKMVFVKNRGDYDAYIRSVFAFEAGKYTTLDHFQKMVHLNLNETDWTWDWMTDPVKIGESYYFVATATYNEKLAPGALTEISLSQIALDSSATNADVEAFGDTYQVLVKSQGIQADGFTDADTALNEGFGKIAEKLPWDNDAPTKGIGLKQALHYYEGGTTQITGSVANVIFGLKKDHTDIVNNYTGTLINVEQDLPAHAYYVKNGSTYDVYVLSNGTIYAPADSKELFASMAVLKTVKTDQLDVSRVTDMTSLFDYCGALQSVDTSDWDTSNVTAMDYMFWGCQYLNGLDTSGWDLSNVKSAKQSFYNCRTLTELDVSGWGMDSAENMNQTFCRCVSLTELDTSEWNTSNVTDMAYLFYECDNLEKVDVSGWDVSNVTRFKGTFYDCPKINGLDVSKWDTSSATEMGMMFYGDYSLESLDVSKWNVSNVGDFGWMFASMHQNEGDMKLQNLDLSNWNPVSATSFNSMFYGCGQLTALDLNNWNMPNLTETSHMFADCFKLATIDVSGWKTPALKRMDGMFNDCRVLVELDMSTFDTSNVTEFPQLFEACYALEAIEGIEKWDTSNGQDFSEMFSGCGSLKKLNLSGFDTTNAAASYLTNGKHENWMFLRFMSGCNKLKEITFGAEFSFDGNGSCPDGYKFVMPAATGVEGWDGKWYTADGTGYLPEDVPDMTAATYYAVKPAKP